MTPSSMYVIHNMTANARLIENITVILHASFCYNATSNIWTCMFMKQFRNTKTETFFQGLWWHWSTPRQSHIVLHHPKASTPNPPWTPNRKTPWLLDDANSVERFGEKHLLQCHLGRPALSFGTFNRECTYNISDIVIKGADACQRYVFNGRLHRHGLTLMLK